MIYQQSIKTESSVFTIVARLLEIYLPNWEKMYIDAYSPVQ